MAVLIFVILFLGVTFPSADLTAQQGVDMGCSPTLASPCSGPGPSPSGTTPPVDDSQQEQIRLEGLKSRFNVLLNQLRGFGIKNIGDLYQAASPATIGELDQRVNRLYVQATYRKRYLYSKYEDNANDLRKFPDALSTLRDKNFGLTAALATAPERLKNAEALRDRNIARANVEERVARRLWNNAEIVEMDMFEAYGGAVWTVFNLLPADRRPAFYAAMKEASSGKIKQKLRQPPPPPEPSLAEPAPLWAKEPGSLGWRSILWATLPTPIPPTGSIETKLNVFEDLTAALADIGPAVSSQERRLAPLWGKWREISQSNAALYKRLMAWESPLEKATALADDAEQRFLTAQINQKLSATNVLKLAASAVAWDNVKNRVVIPQVELILKANGLLGVMKTMEAIDKIRHNPIELISKTGPLKDIRRLLETEKKILGLLDNLEFALEAADANASRNTAFAQTLERHLFFDLDKRAIEIMHTAAGTMDGPLGKIARALMEKAPRK